MSFFASYVDKTGNRPCFIHLSENNQILLDHNGEFCLDKSFFKTEASLYIGEREGRACFAGYIDEKATEISEYDWLHIREILMDRSAEEYEIASRANGFLFWDSHNRFCGKCGKETKREKDEPSKTCISCGTRYYPRIAPAVMVRIYKDDKILLARNGQFSRPFFSTLAGFVEPGETLESTAIREVKEEVGIDIKNLRYFGSQSWTISQSLIIAFSADYAGGTITPDGIEIAEADWFTRDDLPLIPGKGSIATRMIEDFRDSKRP